MFICKFFSSVCKNTKNIPVLLKGYNIIKCLRLFEKNNQVAIIQKQIEYWINGAIDDLKSARI